VSASARLARALLPALLTLSFAAVAHPETPRLDGAKWTRLAAESWLERAQTRARRGDTVDAITAYTEALRIDPNSGAACLGLAELRRALGDLREAERLLGQATRIQDVRAEALARRADFYLSQQKPELALLDLQAAAEADPAPARLRALASFYLARRAWVAALEVYRGLQTRLPEQTSESERRETEDTIAALSALAAEADGAQHDMSELDWVRRALRHIARSQENRGAPEARGTRARRSVAR
jgi:tetratricopeptide (TPR) repeat protein